jgi:hypothetical protein
MLAAANAAAELKTPRARPRLGELASGKYSNDWFNELVQTGGGGQIRLTRGDEAPASHLVGD